MSGRRATAWDPLQQPFYRALWIATLASNIGTWIHDVGSAWLMTSLDPSPIMVALVRTASALPMFLLALPAGALADVVDRRRLLLVTQSWMLAAATALGLLTLAGWTTPGLLLALTALLALGTAFNAPAWHALIPDLVPRAQLHHAVTLNSTSVNLARSVGPAIGGVMVAGLGPAATFLLNALSFLGVILVLRRWRRPRETSVLPAERILGAIRAGLRYVRHAPPVQVVLVRSLSFILFGSVLLTLLPALARFQFQRGPAGYGLLLGAFGVGAVIAAIWLARWRGHLGINRLVGSALWAFASALLGVAWVGNFFLAIPCVIIAGGAWLSLLSTFNASIQTLVPTWVRGRAMAVSILVFFGGMSAGSVIWGWLAEVAGLSWALSVAAVGVLLGWMITRRFQLHAAEDLDLTPSVHWPAPTVVRALEPDRGPVVVTVEYHIDPSQQTSFFKAMQRVRRIRRRDGAISWGLLSDVADPQRYTETFVVESWVEHLRQHERVTQSDRKILDKARAFHRGADTPRVTHYLVENIPRRRRP